MTKSPFHDVKSDGLSFCVTPVELMVDNTNFAHGTGFVWKHADAFYVVTNWHNLSGQNPFTGRHLNEGGRVPNSIRIMPCTIVPQGDQSKIERHLIKIPLYEHFDQPFWKQHKEFSQNGADVAIMALRSPCGRRRCRPRWSARHIGADLLIAGYPYSNYGGLALPVWKRGSLASEPMSGWEGRPAFLIDPASRPGMSGSPVFRRVFGPAASPDGKGGWTIKGDNVMTSEFVGVYAGHMSSQDANVTIGYAWHGDLVEEIFFDPCVGTRL